MFGLCALLLMVSAWALNARVLDFGFLYLRDDDVNVTLNPYMGGLSAARLKWMFTDCSYVRRYIPLGWLNFSATYEVAGLDPGPYHAVALILYVLNCALVFLLVLCALRIFGGGRAELGLGAWEVGAGALAAGWWAFHPFRVETTAWISGNLYGQSMLLLFLSLIAYLRTYLTQGKTRTAWLWAAAVAFAASLLTYPLALGVPFLLVGLDWLRAARPPLRSFGQLLTEKLLFFIPLAGVLAVTVASRFSNTQVFGAVPGMAQLPFLSRLAQSAYVAAYYLWKPWWPVNLSPLYDTLMDFNPLSAAFVFSMGAVAALSAAAWIAFKKRPVFAVVWFGYLACAAPFFGLTEKPHMTSDRYAYFLTVITAALLAGLLARISGKAGRVGAVLASLPVIVLLGHLSWLQLRVWSDDRVQHAYVVTRLTNAELRDDFTSRQLILEFMRGNETAASKAVTARLSKDPSGQGYQKAAALIADKKRVAGYYGTISLLAILQEQTGLNFARSGQPREASDHFEDALRMNDHFYQAAYDRSLVLLSLGRPDDAVRDYFLAQRWARPPVTASQAHEFLRRLQDSAQTEGEPALAAAAERALMR